MRFTLSDSIHYELFEVTDKQIKRFTTSADVAMKACGLRIEAVRAVARETGIGIEDAESRCTDENLLSLLADAVREQFIKNVHAITPSRESSLLFSCCMPIEIVTVSPCLESFDLETFQFERPKDNVITQV